MTVYADVLIVVNYIVNLFMLLAARRILGSAAGRGRMSLAALLGAAGSLVIFLPYIGFWFQFLYKLFLAVAMAAAAFGIKPWQKLIKAVFVTFAVSFLFAGLMLALSIVLAPAGMFYYNGVVYFDISALVLIAATGAAYLVLTVLKGCFSDASMKNDSIMLRFTQTAKVSPSGRWRIPAATSRSRFQELR